MNLGEQEGRGLIEVGIHSSIGMLDLLVEDTLCPRLGLAFSAALAGMMIQGRK
jgi:hypothetical protein